MARSRMSFYSPASRAIDFDLGRRGIEACALTEPPITGARPDTMLEAYRFRRKVGGVYLDPIRRGKVDLNALPFVRRTDGIMRRPAKRREGISIVRGVVEH